MKTAFLHFLRIPVIIAATLVLAGCPSPKSSPRQEHEGKKEWNRTETPSRPEVTAQDFDGLDLDAGYEALRNGKDLVNLVLKPFSKVVLNKTFIEDPAYHGSRLSEMINIFNRAMVKILEAGETGPEFIKIKEEYYQTVFAGCNPNLTGRDCVNADLFSHDGFHTRVLSLLARELDRELDDLVVKFETPLACIENDVRCRELTEERYRLLSMGAKKFNRGEDTLFPDLYLKHARTFAYLVDFKKRMLSGPALEQSLASGPVAAAHAKIFQTLIGNFDTKSVSGAEFKKIVHNFNPWTFSQKRADVFRDGARMMFDLAPGCCLYKDTAKFILDDAVTKAIRESQSDGDAFGLSFRKLIAEIRMKSGTQLFEDLGLARELPLMEDLNSAFYKEHFLVVDRVFRGHWSSANAEAVLKAMPPTRVQEMLAKVAVPYVKVYLIHMIVESNIYMNGIFTSDIASDKVFKYATSRSLELTERWHDIQAQIDLIRTLMIKYSNGQNLPKFGTPLADSITLLNGVNRNIHYFSVVTNMIVMNYFLSKLGGVQEVTLWWGKIKVNAASILGSFFDVGLDEPWFQFGTDAEPVDRQMLLFSWEYLLTTKTLDAFDTGDGDTAEEARAKFFDAIFSRYVSSDISTLREQIAEYERKTEGAQEFDTTETICDYELGKSRTPPAIEITFLNLGKYSYGGLGTFANNALLKSFLVDAFNPLLALRGRLEYRATYMQALVDILEADMIKRGLITKPGQPHRFTQVFYDSLKQIRALRIELAKTYGAQFKERLACLLRVQEVERRRTNRMYLEERKRLGQIYDRMKPMVAMSPEQRVEESARLTRELLPNHRYDVIDGLAYRMYKYDLYRRIGGYITGDIFTKPDSAELAANASDPGYYRPRPVTVDEPAGVENDEAVSGKVFQQLNLTDTKDRETFINRGMQLFNGETGAYVQWISQRAADSDLMNIVQTMVAFYLTGSVTDDSGKTYGLSAEDVIEAYVDIISSFTLDETDVAIALELKSSGRFKRDFFTNRLLEANGVSMPLYRWLMQEVRGRAGLQLENARSDQAQQALDFARVMNGLQPFIFPPTDQVRSSVKRLYGNLAHDSIQKVADIFKIVNAREAKGLGALGEDPRLNRPLGLANKAPYFWYNGRNELVDKDQRENLRILLNDFTRRTDNFYETREKVRLQ